MTQRTNSLKVNIDALNYFGYDLESFSARLALLGRMLGGDVLKRTSCRGEFADQGRLSLVWERAAIVDKLRNNGGLEKVLRLIASDQNGSLTEPHAFWFQLTLGCSLLDLDPNLSFEKRVVNGDRDIMLFNDDLHIECRSFSEGHKIRALFNDSLNSFFASNVSNEDTSIRCGPLSISQPSLHGFSIDSEESRPFAIANNSKHSARFECEKVNEQARIFGQLIEKGRQLIKNKCNLFAVDISLCAGTFQDLQNSLESSLFEKIGSDLSGIIYWRRLWEPDGSPAFSIELTVNGNAKNHPNSSLIAFFPRIFEIPSMTNYPGID